MSDSVSTTQGEVSRQTVRAASSIVGFLGVTLATTLFSQQPVHAAGSVAAWGDNSRLQTAVPPNLTNIVAVAGGSFHSLALDHSGNVRGWGENTFGKATPPAGLSNVVALAAGGDFSLALQRDGTVVAWGNQSAIPAGLTNVAAISAALGNGLALTRNGDVISWGSAAPSPADATNVLAIAAGSTHSLALKGDGSVIAWGNPDLGKTTVPPGLTNVIALAAGQFHSLALRGDGKVVAWGDNTFGQGAIPAGLSNVVAIAAGAFHSLALRSDGRLFAWGDPTYNQHIVPGGISNVFNFAGGRYHSLAVLGDGAPVITVQPVGHYNDETQTARFQVMAAGQQPFSYQWQLDGEDIVGATDSILLVTNVQPADAGVYSVIVSNAMGSVISGPAVLPPWWQRPFFVEQPADLSPFCNTPATFQVDARGWPTLHYQWHFEDAPIEDATNAVLTLNNVTLDQAGNYWVMITNMNGSITSRVATLTVVGEPPQITSPLLASGKQGVAFNYTITGLHNPSSFNAEGLPAGLGVDILTGEIQGIPFENGTFEVLLSATNLCAMATASLTLTFTSSVPVITSALSASGVEEVNFSYQITATESPTAFGGQNLPLGLTVDPVTGLLSGRSVYAGEFDAIITASNEWGTGSTNLHLSFTNGTVNGLAIADVTYDYSSPYLLDFEFSLRDTDDPAEGRAVVVPPSWLTVVCMEDEQSISPTETAIILQRADAKLLKAFLVLDFTDSMASLTNGDSNDDGISDAVDGMVRGAKDFVNQQSAAAQIGVYEFHREDVEPQLVAGLTTDKLLLNEAIDRIWEDYVQDFPAGSRCWDTLMAAITGLGASNRDEQHYVIFVSDGRDESSVSSAQDVIDAALANGVKIYCVGFGAELDPTPLLDITTQTMGRYYTATNAADLAAEFAQIGKDVNGQYLLRWATLKRSDTPFMPSFQISYQGYDAYSPTNPVYLDPDNPFEVDDTTDPPTTNYFYITNIIIATYVPSDHVGDVTRGALRLVSEAQLQPTAVNLRAAYMPRHIRQIRLHYRANYPCTPTLMSTAPGELLEGWTLTETDDGEGGKWLEIASPFPQSLTNSLPFATLGNLIQFTFRDLTNAAIAFSLLEMDNDIYATTGGQSFIIENTDEFTTVYPALPYGTPVPWLMANGFTNDFVNAELSDPDGDGLLTWQEYRANTNPREAASTFLVRSLVRSETSGWYEITFTTSLNRLYQLETSEDLVTWQILQTDIQGTGDDFTVIDGRAPPEETPVFYRVLVY
ncbi:MAG: immunoglobulin domain-containing protein [Verrucomicrobiae bacterium]|nr:immunoglobulin domain-containing protein [Verrucomicrobiae bacterium]